MIDSLFGLIPERSTGRQWVASELQLVNWGGYDGAHRVRFSPTATLLTGGSGSGKSTLMDAYIALIMPHTTPFNGASNGGVVGRPRGQDQRNILSYARGKIDEAKTAEGTKIRVLRGDGRDTWSAIAMTWADQTGARFTAVRAWYVPASAKNLDDVTKLRAVAEAGFDVRDLEPVAAHRFTRTAVSEVGLTPIDTDRDFTARIHSALGIGAAGDGEKAVNLLGRIQAGQQITTVDDLYKKMVLEEPETIATADGVVAHFDELSATRDRMVTAQQQVRALTPIRELRIAMEDAASRLEVIDGIGAFGDETTPAGLWRAGKRVDLLSELESDLSSRRSAAEKAVAEKQALIDAAESERDGLAVTVAASGGRRLEEATREIKAAESRADQVRRAREALEAELTILGAEATTQADFEALQTSAREALVDDDARTTALNAYAAARSAEAEAIKLVGRLEGELADAEKTKNNIPEPLRAARAVLAEAAGLSPAEMPFVGELVEVRTEHEAWREAFNLALGGFATTMLVDAAHVGAFRAAIDSVRQRTRIRYEAVPTGTKDTTILDEGTLPGRLDYRRGVFTGWLKKRLAERHGYVCVQTPALLGQHRMALTVTGQVSQGSRGAHGGQGGGNVLGFTNTRRVAELTEVLETARRDAEKARTAVAEAERAIKELDLRRTSFKAVSALTWDQVDVTGAEAERDRWAAVIEEVTADNPEIATLQKRLKEARAKVDALREGIGAAKSAFKELDARWSDVVEQVDRAKDALEEAAASGTEIAPAQADYLEQLFKAAGGEAAGRREDALAELDAVFARAGESLDADRVGAQETIGAARVQLQQTFESFLERWPNPNLHTDPDASYADFDRLLDELQTSGLHELEVEWRDSLLNLSGNDLTNLDSTLSRAVREIRDRIDPINQILAELPFNDDDHRLRIDTQEGQSAVRGRFRKELRAVRDLIERASTNETREQAYTRMSRLIDRMRRTAPDFADLIDVRNHVRVSAEKVTADTGEHVALYDHIGEKSGGESQELVAFIVGAALRYQLGDAGAERPRYAPVFLDEALIKADARFTGRAIGAWRGLGFQLIIGAPNDKHSAIEPHVDVQYTVLKDAEGHSFPKLEVGLEEIPAG
ncbi:ATP-binding protein [Nocardioides luteus]|uniref:ATP-binding protein n=1 Tax=Nocardioides luteus TaxID=1844 RepID=UPI001E2D416F|nr:SbcC/MukB-like Walker B domain-containing protein [Nocardioides luteus]